MIHPVSVGRAFVVGLIGLIVVAAGPASALSCLRPTVANTYGNAAASVENYVIAVGRLVASGQTDPPEGVTAVNGDINQRVGYTQPARFDGMVFTSSGFDRPWSQELTANVTCIAAWCGSFADQSDALFFFRQAADGHYVLDIDACPGNVFANPTAAQRQQVMACFNDGAC